MESLLSLLLRVKSKAEAWYGNRDFEMAKRHSSLRDLSRDHHHGLALALRLRQGDNALLNDGWTHDRREQAKRVQAFFESELSRHFAAEEKVLFPLMEQHVPESSQQVNDLRRQHVEIADLVKKIGSADGLPLERYLVQLGETLERHIRIEERELFRVYESKMPPDVAAKISDLIADIHSS